MVESFGKMDDEDLENFALTIRVSPRISKVDRHQSSPRQLLDKKTGEPQKERSVTRTQSASSVYSSIRYHQGFRRQAGHPYEEQNFEIFDDVPTPPQLNSSFVVPAGKKFRVSLRQLELDTMAVGVLDEDRNLGFLDDVVENVREQREILEQSLDAVPDLLRKSLRAAARIERREPLFRTMDAKRGELEDLARYVAVVDSDVTKAIETVSHIV